MRAHAREEVVKLFGQGGVGAEIGVWRGDFSAQILERANPSKLYLIDPWVLQLDEVHRTSLYGLDRGPDMDVVHAAVVERFADYIRNDVVSIIRDYSRNALKKISNDSLDFVYIDGDHSYNEVKRDCFESFDKVKSGGLICGDDYTANGWWGMGVIDAFRDLLRERSVIIKYVQDDQIVLQKT